MRRIITTLVCSLFYCFAAVTLVSADSTSVIGSATKISPQEVIEFWTPERMARAVPLDGKLNRQIAPSLRRQSIEGRGEPGHLPPGPGEGELLPFPLDNTEIVTRVGACPASGYENWFDDRNTIYPNCTVGRIFFMTAEGEFCCSGSVIQPNIVLTAGHCVYDAGGWSWNVIFVPGYYYGAEPYGSWAANYAATSTAWIDNGDFSRDIGMLRIEPQWGHNIGDYTSWLGAAWGGDRVSVWHQFGYPSAPPFNGELLRLGMSRYGYEDNTGESTLIAVGSDMTQGASGGPWTLASIPPTWEPGFYVNGLNSCKPLDCQYTMCTPYFDDWFKNLLDYILNVP